MDGYRILAAIICFAMCGVCLLGPWLRQRVIAYLEKRDQQQ